MGFKIDLQVVASNPTEDIESWSQGSDMEEDKNNELASPASEALSTASNWYF